MIVRLAKAIYEKWERASQSDSFILKSRQKARSKSSEMHFLTFWIWKRDESTILLACLLFIMLATLLNLQFQPSLHFGFWHWSLATQCEAFLSLPFLKRWIILSGKSLANFFLKFLPAFHCFLCELQLNEYFIVDCSGNWRSSFNLLSPLLPLFCINEFESTPLSDILLR